MMSSNERGRWMIAFMTCLHASWGLILYFVPLPEATTGCRLSWAIYTNVIGMEFRRAVMLLAATCAALSLRLPSQSRLALWLLLPQQTLLVMPLVGAIEIYLAAPGVELPVPLAWSQGVDVTLRLIFHTFAVLDRHASGGIPGVRDGCLRAIGLR